MRLSTRITLLLTLVLALGALAGDALQSSLFDRQFGSAERISAEGAADEARIALQDEAKELGKRAASIAWSDSLFDALGSSGGARVDDSLDAAMLSEAGFDLVLLTGLEGEVRFRHLRHPDRPEVDSLRQFPSEAINLQQVAGSALDRAGVKDERGVLASGLLETEVGPMLVAVRNIVPASRAASRRGFAIVGRFLGESLAASLEHRLGFRVDVWRVGSPSMPPEVAALQDAVTSSPRPLVVEVDEQRLDTYATLDDLRKRPEFVVRTMLQREIAAAAAVATRSGLLMSLCLALALLLVLIASLRVLVLRPIAGLTRAARHIGQREDYSMRVASDRSDEIGVLGREFDAMLERLEEARRQVIETARAAGMSEIAMGILHNVGNVLNSVNISTSLLTERVGSLCVDELAHIATVLRDKSGDLAKFLTEDPQGKHLQPFLAALVAQLKDDRELIAEELQSLSEGLEHMCELVKSQQGLARATQVIERVPVKQLVEDALRMTERSRSAATMEVVTDLEPDLPALDIDRHKVLEIVVNLVQNARQAIESAAPRPGGHRLWIRAHQVIGGRLKLEVRDTGIGIDPANLTRIFQLGFTTKAKGSGLGLHTAANGAKSLGGALSAHSNGLGHGATFTLEVPLHSGAAAVAA